MAFDDDDNPSAAAGFAQPSTNNDAGAEDVLDDDMPDYKLFMSMFDKKGVSSKSIRKGEKDFESHGTQAQDNALEASRKVMEDVLSYTRIHRGDAWTRGWYFPDTWADGSGVGNQEAIWLQDRVVVMEHERGGWVKDIGRIVSGDRARPGVGRQWLLPEEALHLLERGTIDIWWPTKQYDDLLPRGDAPSRTFGPDDYDAGLPLSLEAAYALLIGHDGERGKSSLPKYQVYSHLKRAGFNVLRAPANRQQPTVPETPPRSLWQWLFSFFSWQQQHKQRPFGPLVTPGLYRAYRPIYQQLALLPRHRPSPIPPRTLVPQDPFRVHFHVWKAGGAPFSKKNPPAPDFRIAVTDTTDTQVPTLEQIEALLESTPHDPAKEAWQGPGRLYQRLKHGHRNVLIAVVDRGLVNFMRFGEGAFGEEALFPRFDNKGPSRGGRKGGHGGRGRGRGRGGRGRGRRA